MSRKPAPSGWAQPGNARKVHFFTSDGRSLCKRWLYLGKTYSELRWLYLGKTYSELPDLEITCAICEKKRQSPFEKYCDTIL